VKPVGTLLPGHPASGINSTSEGWQAGTLTISGIGPESSDAAKLVSLNNVELSTAVAGGRESLIPATITVIADQVRLTNTAIKTDTVGAVPAGNITMDASTIAVDQSTEISSMTTSAGRGGNISFDADQSVTMGSGTHLSAQSTGQGNAGNITINAGSQFLSQGSVVTTEASQASGGNIAIRASDSIRLLNSKVSTSVQGGPETSGGNITIDPTIMSLQNSQILAQAVQGAGGNINIIAGTFLADQTSVVSASSQFGLSGAVNIQSPVSSLSGSLTTLPNRPLQAQPLLGQRCAAQANGHWSSLVVSGRDTLPSEPGHWLISPPADIIERNPMASLLPSNRSALRTTASNLSPRSEESSSSHINNWATRCR
jgi:large exoprotein involved in heme utilization and adhesion